MGSTMTALTAIQIVLMIVILTMGIGGVRYFKKEFGLDKDPNFDQ